MIEFKADCGHTIRARDEDAGKVVRCSYCGRQAHVPEEDDDLDYLLTEVERTGEFDPPPRRWSSKPKTAPKGKGKAKAPIRPRRDFNPLAVVLKMCYAAIIIVVLIVVVDTVYKHVAPWFTGKDDKATVAADPGQGHGGGQTSQTSASSGGKPSSPQQMGLLTEHLNPRNNGLYVTSVPAGAEVYVREWREPQEISIFKDPKVRDKYHSNVKIELSPKAYEVAVALKLTDPELMRQPEYAQLRRDLEGADEDEATRLLERYFLPDLARRVTVETLSDWSKVVVRYYRVEVAGRTWTPLTSLFLPGAVELSTLVEEYLPAQTAFQFDVEAVRSELSLWEVPSLDQTFIIDALHRVGMIPYREGDSGRRASYRLFWINLLDGTISTIHLDGVYSRYGFVPVVPVEPVGERFSGLGQGIW